MWEECFCLPQIQLHIFYSNKWGEPQNILHPNYIFLYLTDIEFSEIEVPQARRCTYTGSCKSSLDVSINLMVGNG